VSDERFHLHTDTNERAFYSLLAMNEMVESISILDVQILHRLKEKTVLIVLCANLGFLQTLLLSNEKKVAEV
jgi:hypothetical protein